ncbi:MAG TPA: hypothetical protein VK090_08085, partial [Paracoccaceae bacterium]|nr:hypothetical protein [Paracoccaceae bacterium]
EVLEDPGIGYARLSDPADPRIRWEINFLPLQSRPGRVDRVIGCLHPLSGGPPWGRRTPLCFQIDHMSVEPLERRAEAGGLAAKTDPFLHEGSVAQGQYGGVLPPYLTAIEGDGVGSGRPADEQARRRREHLRLVKE